MSQSKTTANKPKMDRAISSGKRRLNFDDGSRALKNKTFFLDLPGHKNIDHLERELTMRGGKIEKFFHRGVKYLVTNRCRDESRSTPSPLTPSQKGGMSVKSPLESVSPVEPGSKPVAWGTRAALMVAASQKKSGSKKKVDVIGMAKFWGCKVVTLEALLLELKKLKPLPQTNKDKSRAPCGRVHALTPPFLKVEDQSRGYRPLVHEPKVWLRPRPDTSPNGCPFDSPRTTRSAARSKSSRGSPSPSKPRTQEEHPMVTRLKKPGYCECCAVRYRDLQMHLRSGKHVEYANNEANFARLDRLISQGTKFNDFVSRLRNKRRSPVKNSSPLRRSPRSPAREAVVLVTPPSPARATTPRRATTPTRRSPTKRFQSPRGRKSPRFHLNRDGMALRPSPKKTITLEGSVFTSPKTGELKITPLTSPAVDREFTPGFKPPQGARIEAIARQLAQSTGVSRKRQREEDVGVAELQGLRKRACYEEEVVPETPEKPVTRSAAVAKKLCNLDSVLERASIASPKTSTRGTPSPPRTSPIRPRKSPRLAEKRNRTRGASRSSPRPKCLIVSYNLRHLAKKAATPTSRCPVSNGITPEIALQGCSHPVSCKCDRTLPESPLAGLVCQRLFESSGSEGTFPGFAPATAKQALGQLMRGCGRPASSPLAKTTLSIGGRGHRSLKRGRSEGDGAVCVSNVINPESKRRRVAARKSPRGHQ